MNFRTVFVHCIPCNRLWLKVGYFTKILAAVSLTELAVNWVTAPYVLYSTSANRWLYLILIMYFDLTILFCHIFRMVFTVSPVYCQVIMWINCYCHIDCLSDLKVNDWTLDTVLLIWVKLVTSCVVKISEIAANCCELIVPQCNVRTYIIMLMVDWTSNAASRNTTISHASPHIPDYVSLLVFSCPTGSVDITEQ